MWNTNLTFQLFCASLMQLGTKAIRMSFNFSLQISAEIITYIRRHQMFIKSRSQKKVSRNLLLIDAYWCIFLQGDSGNLKYPIQEFLFLSCKCRKHCLSVVFIKCNHVFLLLLKKNFRKALDVVLFSHLL